MVYQREVGIDHLGDKLIESDGVAPTEALPRFGRVTSKMVHFERSEVSAVDLDEQAAGAAMKALLVDTLASPDEFAADP